MENEAKCICGGWYSAEDGIPCPVHDKTVTETKQKHTPGPWQDSGEYDRRSANDVFSTTVIPENGDACIAIVFGAVRKGCQANARLIAAAPELLEALKLTLRNIENKIHFFPAKLSRENEIELESLKTWAKICGDAIAKAEGR